MTINMRGEAWSLVGQQRSSVDDCECASLTSDLSCRSSHSAFYRRTLHNHKIEAVNDNTLSKSLEIVYGRRQDPKSKKVPPTFETAFVGLQLVLYAEFHPTIAHWLAFTSVDRL